MLACALMPVVSTLLAYVAFPTLWLFREQGTFQLVVGDDQGTHIFAVLSGLIAVVVTVAGAVPMFYTLTKRGPVSLKQTLMAGLALGNAPVALFGLLMAMFAILHVVDGAIANHRLPLHDLVAGSLLLITVGSMLGLTCAAVFWSVVILGTDASASTPGVERG